MKGEGEGIIGATEEREEENAGCDAEREMEEEWRLIQRSLLFFEDTTGLRSFLVSVKIRKVTAERCKYV